MSQRTPIVTLNTFILLGLLAVGCGPQVKSPVRPTNFAANRQTSQAPAQTTSAPEEKESKEESDKIKDLANENAMLALENKREKLKLMQERLTSKEERKNTLETQITSVETELAKTIVPTQNNTTAAVAAYYGDYATAYISIAQQKAAIAAAETKKANLTTLADQRKAELVIAKEEVAALKLEVDALANEIEADTQKLFSTNEPAK